MTALLGVLLDAESVAFSQSVGQSDWSGGPGSSPVVTEWQDSFEQAAGISWLAIPGQLALSSSVRPMPEVQSVANGQLDGAESVFAADVDGDGDVDLVGAGYSGEVSWWSNNGGRPIVWTKQVLDRYFPGANQIFVADVDGDGDNDVLGAAYDAGWVAWWRNGGGEPTSWSRHLIDENFGGACSVYACDLDGDGDMDVLSTGFDIGVVAWWEQIGATSEWQRHTIGDSIWRAHEVWADDLDGDGDLDVAAASWDGPRLLWWRNDGGDPPVWTQHVIDSSFAGGSSLDIADLDGDGDPDILAAARNLNQVAWWRNDGGSPLQWSKHVIADDRFRAWSVYAADVDGDGRRDALAGIWTDHEVIWWRNLGGDPVEWAEVQLCSVYGGASAVHAGDVDGDGDLEVVATAYGADDLRLWSPTDFVSWGRLTSQVIEIADGSFSPICHWSAEVPEGTTLLLEARGGEAADGLGAWHELQRGWCLPALEGSRFIQYRVTLESSDPARSPILHDVELGWLGGTSLPPRQPSGRRWPW